MDDLRRFEHFDNAKKVIGQASRDASEIRPSESGAQWDVFDPAKARERIGSRELTEEQPGSVFAGLWCPLKSLGCRDLAFEKPRVTVGLYETIPTRREADAKVPGAAVPGGAPDRREAAHVRAASLERMLKPPVVAQQPYAA